MKTVQKRIQVSNKKLFKYSKKNQKYKNVQKLKSWREKLWSMKQSKKYEKHIMKNYYKLKIN